MGVPATTGQLRTNIEDMEIGDYIDCTSASGSINHTPVGHFANIGISSAVSELPLTGSNTTTGKFYFVKVAKGVLISDRVTRHTVTWDALNSARYIQGVPSTSVNLLNANGIIRSLTGGVAYADANGNMSLTDKGFGAWPTNNEWDRYIMKFPTDKIQNGKTLDDVFHHNYEKNGTITWVQETPAISLGASTYRVRRAESVSGSWSANVLSSGSYVHTGFRPVFEYREV